jgi:hypothetical protein
MCARNYLGGAERPFVGKNEITLEFFKKHFSKDFLSNITNFYACGNYGDPIIAKDCLEIFEYVRSCTSGRLSIHTNGSARSKQWWANLAVAMKGTHDVTFGIDGFADSHVLYRRGTDWNKIIENATSFINAGGNANVDCLVFKHNEPELEQFEKEMLAIGFTHVNFKSTGRFYDMPAFPVQDVNGNLEYYLEPAQTATYKKINFLKLDEISNNIKIWEDMISGVSIKPQCVQKREIYVDAAANIMPCCWVGSDMVEEDLTVSMSIHDLRNRFVANTKANFADFAELNLNKYTLDEILDSSAWDFISSDKKPWTCAKNCKND